MKINRTKNTFRSVFWGLINKGITLILPFIIRTLIIYVFGVEYAGLNGLFASILQMLNLAELGFSNAIVYSMYKPIAENDETMISVLLNYYRDIYRKIGVFIFIVGIGIMPFIKFLINGTYPGSINIYILYLLYLLQTSVSYLCFAYKSAILVAYQRNDIISKINTGVHLFQNLAQILVILLWENFYVYLSMSIVFTVINNYCCYRRAGRIFPNISCRGVITKEIKNEVGKSVRGLMLTKICQVSRNSLDTICISAFVGLAATTIYTNYFYILTTIAGIVNVLLTSMSAGIGNSVATESIEKNYEDMNKFTFMYVWIASVCTCCFCCLYQPFMIIWMGEELLLPFGCMALMCLYFFLLRLGDIRSQYFYAKGLWWQGKWVYVIETLANLILNVILGYYFQVWGILLATIITVACINHTGSTIVLFRNYFKKCSIKRYFADCIKYTIVTTLTCLLSYCICNFVNLEGVLGLIVKLVVCFTISNFVLIICYYKNEHFKQSFIFAKKLLNNIKGVK